MRVLAVVAHPDDEALGCGGTLAKFADGGHDCTVLLPLRREDPRGVKEWGALLAQFNAAVRHLRGTPVVLDPALPESQADPQAHTLHDLILPFVDSADLVLTHWMHDVNQVHRGVSHAVEIATRPFRRRRDVSLFEIPTSTNQVFGGTDRAFSPSQYVVLTREQLDRKLAAFAMYTSEQTPGRTVGDVERLARARGAEIGVEYAEAFVVARQFR